MHTDRFKKKPRVVTTSNDDAKETGNRLSSICNVIIVVIKVQGCKETTEKEGEEEGEGKICCEKQYIKKKTTYKLSFI